MQKRTGLILAIFAFASTILAASFTMSEIANAGKPQFYQELVKGVAVGGYDPVSYFKDGKPVVGNKAINHKYKGATWRFSSEVNKKAFIADPAKYAPQYGGYCAWAVSQGYTAKGDPHAWKIHNGKLYLNYNKSVQATWARNIPGNIKKGDKNWPNVLDK